MPKRSVSRSLEAAYTWVKFCIAKDLHRGNTKSEFPFSPQRSMTQYRYTLVIGVALSLGRQRCRFRKPKPLVGYRPRVIVVFGALESNRKVLARSGFPFRKSSRIFSSSRSLRSIFPSSTRCASAFSTFSSVSKNSTASHDLPDW